MRLVKPPKTEQVAIAEFPIKRYFNLFALFFLQSYFYVAFSCNDIIVIICGASGNQILGGFIFVTSY